MTFPVFVCLPYGWQASLHPFPLTFTFRFAVYIVPESLHISVTVHTLISFFIYGKAVSCQHVEWSMESTLPYALLYIDMSSSCEEEIEPFAISIIIVCWVNHRHRYHALNDTNLWAIELNTHWAIGTTGAALIGASDSHLPAGRKLLYFQQ